MDSVWWDNCERTELGTLSSDLKVDVLIIGGGMAGILCAHRLKTAGVDCAVVEAGRIFGMTTKNTTAKITSCHGLIYDKMIKMRGVDAARGYLMSQNAACREFARLCRDVNCDYETRDSYVYSRNDREKLEREVRAIERLGGSAELCDITELPIKTAGGVRVHDQAQFNPLKLGYKIAKDLPIYENTRVTRILPGRVKTEHGEIRCEKIIVATHFPVLNRHGSYFLKMYQHRSYVLAVENAQKLHGMYVDEDERGMSFRSYGEVLLLGGGAHRTGKHGGSYAELERFGTGSESYRPGAAIGPAAARAPRKTTTGRNRNGRPHRRSGRRRLWPAAGPLPPAPAPSGCRPEAGNCRFSGPYRSGAAHTGCFFFETAPYRPASAGEEGAPGRQNPHCAERGAC